MFWQRRKQQRAEMAAIHAAFGEVMTGKPFMLIVETENAARVSVIVGEGLKTQTIINALKAIAQSEPKFKKALPDMLIELSKSI